jgi:hypothetical protein
MTMNKTRMLELADAIEAAPPHKFDMESFVGKYKIDKAGRRRRLDDVVRVKDTLGALRSLSCGTSACIAGWAIHLHPRAGLSAAYRPSALGGTYYDVQAHAQAVLGLTDDEADALFHRRMSQTNVQAAAFLRRCVELGTVPGA